MFPELATDSCGSNTDNGLEQRILEIIEKRTEILMNEADIDGDDSINILEFNEAIKKFTANDNQNNLAQSKPPNGGWGWVIVFSCFILNLVIGKLHMKMLLLVKDCFQRIRFQCFYVSVGFGYSFGIFLDPLIEYYDSDPSTVSWVGSLFLGTMSMCGPIVGGLVNEFGLRPICITGSIVISLGLCLSVLSPNVPILVLTFSVISGFGAGLIFLPAQVAKP
jgi:hypothetical protein